MPALRRRRDPAPSRWGYRLNRWMLTPLYRHIFFVGVPVALIVGLLGAYVMEPARQKAISDWMAHQVDRFQHRPEFMVEGLSIEGGDAMLAADVELVLQVELPASSFHLDLEDMRVLVEALPRVEAASVRISAGTLVVDVIEREPVAIWRTASGLRLLDETGVFVGPLDTRSQRADLPVIAGAGAKEELAEALELFATAAPIGDRVRGLVRMGERRWDMVLDRDQRILLPTEGAIAALSRVIVLAETEELLNRDVLAVDMRNGQRPTVRMTPGSSAALREIRLLGMGEPSE